MNYYTIEKLSHQWINLIVAKPNHVIISYILIGSFFDRPKWQKWSDSVRDNVHQSFFIFCRSFLKNKSHQDEQDPDNQTTQPRNQNNKRHFSKISLLSDFVDVSWFPLEKKVLLTN